MKIKHSNCLIEAIRQWVSNPIHIKIKRYHKWNVLWKEQRLPHFYWYNKKENKNYHFTCVNHDEPFYKQFWFEGYVDELIVKGER